MVRIPSVTGSERDLAEFICKWANDNGFDAFIDDTGNLIARKGTGGDILLVGHMDTFPGEPEVKVEDGKLYGRGSVDAKGALSAFLLAAAASSNEAVTIIGTVDEEGSSTGASALIGVHEPSFVIIGEPSGWDGITLGYRGRAEMIIGLSDRCGHATSPGANTIERTVSFHSTVMELIDRNNSDRSMFTSISARLMEISTTSDGLEDHTAMRYDLRLPVGLDTERFVRSIKALGPEYSVELSKVVNGVRTERSGKLTSSFVRAIRRNGGSPRFILKTGSSDMNVLQAFDVPILSYGPGDQRLDHTPEEHISLEEHRLAIDILTSVLDQFG